MSSRTCFSMTSLQSIFGEPDIKLYSYYGCPFAQRTWITLELYGLNYEYIEVDLQDKPAILWQINPRGKVPVIVHQGKSIYESNICNEYIHEAFPQSNIRLFPRGAYAKARCRIMLDIINNKIQSNFYKILTNIDAEQRKISFQELKDNLLKIFEMKKEFESEKPNEYLTANFMSIVDIALIPFIIRLDVIKHYRPEFTIENDVLFKDILNWKSLMIKQSAVKTTICDNEKLIETYRKYYEKSVQ